MFSTSASRLPVYRGSRCSAHSAVPWQRIGSAVILQDQCRAISQSCIGSAVVVYGHLDSIQWQHIYGSTDTQSRWANQRPGIDAEQTRALVAPALHRPCTCPASALHRPCTSTAPAQHRPCINPASARHRQCISPVPALHRPCVSCTAAAYMLPATIVHCLCTVSAQSLHRLHRQSTCPVPALHPNTAQSRSTGNRQLGS